MSSRRAGIAVATILKESINNQPINSIFVRNLIDPNTL